MTKKAKLKIAEGIVERAYYANCSGIEVNVMDISKVFTFGVQALAEGQDLSAVLRPFVLQLAGKG